MSLTDAGPEFLTRLENALGPGCVFSPEARYLEEPRGLFTGRAGAVVKPRTTADVAETVRQCSAARVGIVPYGGGTGLAGGQVLGEGALPVVLSLERMHDIREIDPGGNILVAGAGAILADVQAAAVAVDRHFPLSLASEGSCRIGGILSTNAGGVQVLRYGNARNLCLGIEAVLPDGSVLHGLSRLHKDNTGYDLRHLLIGAEGTLGIITAASLRMVHRPSETRTAFLAVASPKAALDVLDDLLRVLGPSVSALELIHRTGLDFLVETGLEFIDPLRDRPEWMLLVEAGGTREEGLGERFETALGRLAEAGRIGDAVVAQSEAQRARFWEIRELIPEANKRIGALSSHDISVPVAAIPAFISEAEKAVAEIRTDLRINCFGHLGDGNLHFNVFAPKGVPRDDLAVLRPGIKECVYDMVAKFGGSFSAEHGVGRLKVAELEKYGDPAKLNAMRAIKQALDPLGIMNPGAVLRRGR